RLSLAGAIRSGSSVRAAVGRFGGGRPGGTARAPLPPLFWRKSRRTGQVDPGIDRDGASIAGHGGVTPFERRLSVGWASSHVSRRLRGDGGRCAALICSARLRRCRPGASPGAGVYSSKDRQPCLIDGQVVV